MQATLQVAVKEKLNHHIKLLCCATFDKTNLSSKTFEMEIHSTEFKK